MRKVSNYMTFYLRILLYMFTALAMYLLACAPLASLFVFSEGSRLRYAALLTPMLLIFVVLPLRFSFADALVQELPRDQNFLFSKAYSFKHYFGKLAETLLHLINIFKWGIPFLALIGVIGYSVYNMGGDMNFADVFNMITKIGDTLLSIWNAIANFFITLFGSVNKLESSGSAAIVGISAILVLTLITILVWCYGIVRNSATRYIWVIATRKEHAVRGEIRSRLSGRRWQQFLAALVNFVLLLPFLLGVVYSMRGVISDLSTAGMMAIAHVTQGTVPFASAVIPLVVSFVLLYMPLVPARRYLTAAFATRGERRMESKEDKDEAQA